MVQPKRMTVRSVSHFFQRVVSLIAALVFLSVLAVSLGAYLAATGTSLPLLRAIATKVGELVAGQRTEQLTLNVRVLPQEGQLAGTATLSVRSLEDGRRRFYFLLNDGLHLRSVRSGDQGAAQPVAAYQLWLLTVVDLGTAVAKNDHVTLTFDYAGTPDTRLFGVATNFVSPQSVLLNVDSFWYPSDVQGFFTTDVTVTLPNGMTVAHNGSQVTHAQRGDVQQVHWRNERPVAGLALIAGAYTLAAMEADGIAYRLYLPPDLPLDANRVLTLMRDANRTFNERYGPSGFNQLTMFVTRDLRRAFNDGSGLMGLSIRYVRAGDYGFGTIAHEIAHDWWGDTVAAKWLSPGNGGEWIVEGFAEFSSLIAAENEFGPQALTRRLASELFDPAHQGVVASMSVLDNALAEPVARDTIYRKGAYVAAMLRRTLGDDVYFRGLRQFLERYKYQAGTDHDLQQVLQEVSGQNLDGYFADWIRSDHLADLSIDGTNQAAVTISNLGTASIPGDIDLWTFKKGGSAPIPTTVHVGDHVPLDSDTDFMVLDPLLAWADVQRENNRYPRRNDPVHVAASRRGELAVTYGAGFPWVRASIASLDSSGRTQHTWEFNRGTMEAPAWSPDGSHLIVSSSEAEAPLPTIVSLAAEGARQTVGYATSPLSAPEGVIYAAKRDRIVRWAVDGSQSTVVRRCGELVDQPVPSPDGARLAYTAARNNHLELRVIAGNGSDDRLLASWDRDRLLYRWSTDGTRLYAAVGGTWDWQIWEVPLDAEPVQVLASAAAAIGDLAVSSDGNRLAFTAAPTLDYPNNRRQLYVMNLKDRAVRNINVPNADLTELAWADSDSLVVLATATEQPWTLPATHTLKRVRLSDGSAEDLR